MIRPITLILSTGSATHRVRQAGWHACDRDPGSKPQAPPARVAGGSTMQLQIPSGCVTLWAMNALLSPDNLPGTRAG